MTLLSILLVIVPIVGTIVEIVTMFEIGTPISDEDLSDFLNKIKTKNIPIKLYKEWNGKFRLYFERIETPSIIQTQYSIIFPYYIVDVGVIPIWSSSYRRVKDMFTNEINKSPYTSNKRSRLGL